MPNAHITKTKNKHNSLRATGASSKIGPGRRKEKDASSKHQRSAETITRLKMYANGKAIRNKAGQVVAGNFMMSDRAGDREITASTGRIAPDRRWFGNTRVVDGRDLDAFRKEMTETVADPYSVVLKRKKLPMGLLHEVAEYNAAGNKKAALLEQEPFHEAFGKGQQRKRIKLDQYMVSRTVEKKQNDIKKGEGQSEKMERPETGEDAYAALLTTAQKSQGAYQEINASEGIVPWGRDRDIERTEGEGVDWRHEKKDDLFLKGEQQQQQQQQQQKQLNSFFALNLNIQLTQ
jgi:nuclear GTP-binding protein